MICAFISQSKESIPFESSSSYDVRQSTMHASECSNVWYSDTYLFPFSPTCSQFYLLRIVHVKSSPVGIEFELRVVSGRLLSIEHVVVQDGMIESNPLLIRGYDSYCFLHVSSSSVSLQLEVTSSNQLH